MTEVILTPIYEAEFLGFSYGFRRGRGAHDALDALAVGLTRRKINWVADCDIRAFFDNVSRDWMVRFLEHRIGDKRVIRLIIKWLNAGVMEAGEWRDNLRGTPQGSVVSPVLANIYLHYVLDLWFQKKWRSHEVIGEAIIVRYADDFVVGFQHQRDAERFLDAAKDRFGRFGLDLHPDKTRLIEFGRYATQRRQERGQGRPETFDFLGFTHYCAASRGGRFQLGRKPVAKRMSRTCGRRLYTHYQGRTASPGYHCPGKDIVQGRGVYCLNIGGVQIDRAVSEAVLDAVRPAGLEATLGAAEQIEADHDSALEQWRLAVERARYEAERAERRYRAVEPENRLVARGLETEWEQRLSELEQARAELERRERRRPRELTADERQAVLALGADLQQVWDAPTTTARDKKELLRTLLDEVVVSAPRGGQTAHLTLRWRGGLLTELDIDRPQTRHAPIRTDEDTVELVRRLARHYPDAVIAGILSRQGKKTAYGHTFTAMHVGNVRRRWNLGCFDPATRTTDGELVSIQEAARRLDMAPSTLHRWINDGFIAGEQLTPGAPWRIRVTPELLARFVEQPPEGYVPMQDATRILGVSRQTVLQRVKRGELDAVHVHRGKRKGLRIKVIDDRATLFEHSS